MRTAILLGAGASADAGLPLTNQLARQLVAKMNREAPRSEETAALNFVYGAMVNHLTEQGGDPLGALNVETMFSAIRLLRDRREHEAAPFVSWKPSVGYLDFDRRYNATIADRLRSGVAKSIGTEWGGSGDGLLEAVTDLVRAEIGAGGSGDTYRRLERQLRGHLVEILRRSRPVRYLAPIAELARSQAGGLDVTTLNYDTTIERMARSNSIPVNTGVESWSPGNDLVFEPSDRRINLIKLHGSISWVNERRRFGAAGLDQTFPRARKPTENEDAEPAIVIGGREKLETEGATLLLLRAFIETMRRADRLVIVGYSGGDPHVNSVIRDWVNANEARTITVLDPYWPDLDSFPRSSTFSSELNRRLGVSTDPGSIARRMAVMRSRATAGLQAALEEVPATDPVPWFVSQPHQTAEVLRIQVTNVGRQVGPVTFYARDFGPGRANVWPDTIVVAHPEAQRDPHVVDLVRIPSMSPGETVTVELIFRTPEDAARWSLRVRGKREIDWVEELLRGREP